MLPPEPSTVCDHCGKPSVCSLGKDKIPLCLEHFEIVLSYLGKMLNHLKEMLK